MSTPALILHHYKSSPFAKKVRLALGLKDLEWASVEVAPQPPRPLLDPLTGGYRRIPVLQAGADIFCDTNIILRALERLHPEPTFYPETTRALAEALSFAWERDIWLAAIGVRVHAASDDAPADFLRDRKDDYLYVDMSKAAMEPKAERNVQHVRAQVAKLADALSDGRPYLFGNKPGALDLAYFHILWLMRGSQPKAVDAMLDLAPVLPWFERVAAIGHGRHVAIGGEDAVAAASAVQPRPPTHLGAALAGDPAPGTVVTVTPDDFARVPVEGTLVGADHHEVVIHRTNPDTGDLHLHFPRAGFVVSAA